MATRTAIAAQDRAAKKEIAEKDRRESRRQFDKKHALDEQRAIYEGMERSASTVKNISQAAFGKQGLAGAMAANDPAWYKKFNLNAYSVNLPTFYRLGSELKPKWLNATVMDTVPGIAVINFVPTLPNNYTNASYPNTEYRNSPINQSLTRFMAELRKLNSRIGDYDPSDLGLYWYSIIGIMYNLGRLTKALKFYNTYYAENRYFAKACIKSCGFDVDDFLTNVPVYKSRLMKWIAIFNANVVLPNSLDLLKRAFWISNVVVKEHKTNCSQIYHFNPVVNMHLADEETHVILSKIASEFTFASFESWMEDSIQNLFNSVGVVTMTADLRAAFPDSVLLKYPEFNSSDTIIYSESIHDLEQIHNLRTLPVTETSNASFGSEDSHVFGGNQYDLDGLNIVVDSAGYLGQGIIVSGSLKPLRLTVTMPNESELPIFYNGTNANFLNFYDSDYVSDDAILEATRLRFILNGDSKDLGGCSFKYNGTEIVTDVVLVCAEQNNDDYNCIYIYTEVDLGSAMTLSNQEMYGLSFQSTFDWMPTIMFYGVDDEQVRYTYGEIDHAVYLGNDNLKVIHEGCAFSLFYINDFSKSRVV